MNKTPALVALAAAFSFLSLQAGAQSYVVNGHPATQAEVRLLASYGAHPGHWVVNGFSFVVIDETPLAKQTIVSRDDRSCWYDHDMPHCERWEQEPEAINR
jgi:hypothetical protein